MVDLVIPLFLPDFYGFAVNAGYRSPPYSPYSSNIARASFRHPWAPRHRQGSSVGEKWTELVNHTVTFCFGDRSHHLYVIAVN